MRLILLSSLFAYLLSSWISPTEDKFLKKCLYPTVAVVNTKKDATGTGIVVKSIPVQKDVFFNVVLSCEHIVNTKLNIAEHIYENRYFNNKLRLQNAITVAKSKEFDISIIVFLSENKLPIADVKYDHYFKLKEEVFHVGCGLSGSPRLSEGKVTDISTNRNDINAIRTSICMVPGDSGGALFNSNNQVVGIANSIKTLETNGITVPVTNISYFKPTQLFTKCFKKEDFDFLYTNDNFPSLIKDYLWLSEVEYQN